jgi:hypothetical protein
MTLDDWRWNAEQFNRIAGLVNTAGMRFAQAYRQAAIAD